MSLNRSRGDTLIEVLLAVTIFSMVSVVSVAAMNRSSATAERALEITLVKQQIDSQAEELRAAQQAAPSAPNPATSPWASIKAANDITTPTVIDDTCPNPPSGSFYMIPTGSAGGGFPERTNFTTRFVNMSSPTAPPYAQVAVDRSYGIWVEKDTTTTSGFRNVYTFTVRACWYSVGLNAPMQLDTTVRLYDSV